MSNLPDIDKGRNNDLTVDEIKACTIFRHLTDEQAREVAVTIKRFSEIVFHHHLFEKHSSNSGKF